MAGGITLTMNEGEIERIRRAGDIRILEGDRRGPLRIELQKTHIKQVNRAFRTRGASVKGGPWPGWSAGYAAWRAKHNLGNRMMVLTGTLKEKFTKSTHGSFVSRFVKPFRYQFGAIDDVAAKHHFEGVGRPPKFRSVIRKTPKQLKEFQETVKQFWIKFVDQHLRNL